jgi:uncharacterized protein YndB with AHSA1/START domain
MPVRKNSSPEDEAVRQIVIIRVFDAPRELVWQAMTDPKHVVNWWGPRGFTTTVETMDVRPGGVWKHTMHGPDGTNYPNKSVFQEVVKPERIVYSHGGGREGGPGATFVATWTFEVVEDGKTRVTIRMVFPSAEARDFVVKEYGAIEGGKQTLERLGEFLAAQSCAATGREIVTTRVVHAPRELVWKAWTDPDHLASWWGPRGFRNTFRTFELRAGGHWRFVMHGPDGSDYENESIFREVAPPERLVFDHVSEHPFRVTATFESVGDETRVTFRMLHETVEACGKVRSFVVEANEQNFDRLEAELVRMRAGATT